MTAFTLAKLLIEHSSEIDPRVGVVMNRAMLQLFSQQSVTAFLKDAGISVKEDGTHVLEFVFNELPHEVIPQIERLLGTSHFSGFKWSGFRLNGHDAMGLSIEVKPDDLPQDTVSKTKQKSDSSTTQDSKLGLPSFASH